MMLNDLFTLSPRHCRPRHCPSKETDFFMDSCSGIGMFFFFFFKIYNKGMVTFGWLESRQVEDRPFNFIKIR